MDGLEIRPTRTTQGFRQSNPDPERPPAWLADRRPSHKGACMAEEKVEPREVNWRQLLPWTELFQGFWVMFNYQKIVLAAAGILVMAFGWWLLANVFYSEERPAWKDVPKAYLNRTEIADTKEKQWTKFKEDR